MDLVTQYIVEHEGKKSLLIRQIAIQCISDQQSVLFVQFK